MPNALVTIVCPLGADRALDAETAIAGLGNPARAEVAQALGGLDPDGSGTHFASLHVVRSTGDRPPYILFEFSADGGEKAAIGRIVRTAGPWLLPVFVLAADWRDGGDLEDYLSRKAFRVGGGWFADPGVCFAGTPGLSVGRIASDHRLAREVATLLDAQPGGVAALDRLAAVRAAIAGNPDLSAALVATPPQRPFAAPSTPAIVLRLATRAVGTYLWPVLPFLLVVAGAAFAWALLLPPPPGPAGRLGHAVAEGLAWLWRGLWIAAVLVVAAAAIAYASLRRTEAADPTDDRAPDAGVNAAMFDRENRCAQNHMISITRRKPGAIRSFTSRLVFWGLGQAAGYVFPPGFLGSIGTIHFARWVTPPGTRDVIFLSNYGGSWESYLEDFITRAHQGLTGVWSNSIGFPRSENLVQRGATDGERFKRFARRSMVPTPFWFSAYPTLTTAAIRGNVRIREGLAGVMTEDEAEAWIALFGSAPRPVSKLVSNGVQSLILGGLGFLPSGTCLIHDLPEDLPAARWWLDRVQPLIAFDDGRRLGRDAVVTLALGAWGLRRLGLSEDALSSFPFAFVGGMNDPARNRILGDLGESDPSLWRWGQRQPDVALLVYGVDGAAVDALEADLQRFAADAGVEGVHRIRLNDVTPGKTEPFGFVDGISQPVIRGTYKSFRDPDPIHLVEPGEFILGYPDNRDNLPPGPTLAAIDDPANLLPLVGGASADDGGTLVGERRDLGFNGSFLVIRELEQDVERFDAYCGERAAALAGSGRFRPPYDVTPDFVAAKIIGRWRDGSSLVRFPYNPRTDPGDEIPAGSMVRPTSRPVDEATPVAPPVAAAAPPSAAAPKPVDQPAVPPAGQSADNRGGGPYRTSGRAGGDNDFLFGSEDPEALRCPFGAHIRRANPRDSLDPGSAEQVAISNRHRIIRVGRSYRPAEGARPGLLFMCLNGDIERQFEFLQQTWLRSPSFHGLSCEKDPLLGDAEVDACGFTIPTRDGPARLAAVPQFVATRGGGYFFVPGRRLVDFLRRPPS